MKRIKITVMKKARYDDLIAEYENPMENACDMELGRTFVSYGGQKPEGFCQSAWETVSPFVESLARGEGNFFGGWMKNPDSAMLSCNDGFRPVSFLVETERGEPATANAARPETGEKAEIPKEN